jgi:NodT family efflux transporter outer membrane factor (OMF) lipoprotein
MRTEDVMKKPMKSFLLPAALLLSSCAIFAPDDRTGLNDELPERFSLYSEEAPDTLNLWWESFQSPELNRLIGEALTNSPSIQQARARLAQAEALAVQAGAARVPSVGYDGAAARTENSSPDVTIESYSLGLNASYELDLWGRIKSQAEAAALDRDASREQLNTAMMTLTARVASRWSAILSQRLQLEVIRNQLASNETALELIELRFRKSLSSALDVYQQRQTVAGTASAIPLAELNEELLNNELAALLGRADPQSLAITNGALPDIEAVPAIGIPADVLANRPDVRQAGLQLKAADWSVSAARADRLPAIRLSASASYLSDDTGSLFDDWITNLAGSLAGPIFEGGRRRAEVERTRAVADERLAAYRAVVINAIREVEDALISEEKQRDYLAALDERLDAARLSYGESINRYRNGLIEYTTVLIQLDILQSLERERVASQYQLIQYRINLYRALGGTWPNELMYSRNEDIP